MRFSRFSRSVAVVALAALATAACEDEVTGIDNGPIEGQLTIDASDPLAFTYFTFADGGSVVTVADPSTSTDWDMAFRRFTVKLNGGVAGPGDVAGANLENNAALDSAQILALTTADGDAAFEAVTLADVASATLAEDDIVADPTSWLSFTSMGPVANPTAAWKVRLADGEFALMRAIEFVFAPAPSATFEVRHQAAAGTLGAIDTVTADLSGGPAFVDLESGASVAPAGCTWDIQVSPSADLVLNDACNAGTFPLGSGEDFATLTTASDAPEYGGFLSVVSGAFPTSFDGPEGVFWYDIIAGSNRLSPTYNVFLVRVGTSVYKVQVTDYYNATGAAGFPTVRFELLQ